MPIWMLFVEWSARLILVILILLSVWSVQIILDRKKYFKNLLSETPSDLNSENVQGEVYQQLLKRISGETSAIKVERIYENFLTSIRPTFEKGLPVLGSLGGTAPFIGLLGTVLGIIKAFGDLSINSQNTNKIMFLLAEALVLTAVGLVVAIPAVMAFNYFNRQMKTVFGRLNSIKNAYLNTLD